MTCLSCGHQNQPGARFCSICGTALEVSRATCPSCGKEVAADDHFCGACGSSLVPTREPSDAIPQRDLGGLLAETWSVYRENLRPFVLIALVPQIPSAVSLMIPSMGSAVFGVMLALVGFFLYILVSGAVIYAVVQQQVGSAVDVGECFAQAWRKALSLVVAYILFALALLASGFLMLILIGVPLFFYLLVAWFFFSEAIMIEGKGAVAAFGRSRGLVRGSWWRVFGIGVVFVLLIIGVSIVGAIAGFVVSTFSGPAGDVLFFFFAVLVTPYPLIGGTLLYLDLRARKEGTPWEPWPQSWAGSGSAVAYGCFSPLV